MRSPQDRQRLQPPHSWKAKYVSLSSPEMLISSRTAHTCAPWGLLGVQDIVSWLLSAAFPWMVEEEVWELVQAARGFSAPSFLSASSFALTSSVMFLTLHLSVSACLLLVLLSFEETF